MLTAVSHILFQIKIQLQKGDVFLKNAFYFASDHWLDCAHVIGLAHYINYCMFPFSPQSC